MQKKWYDFNDLPLQKLWKAVFEDKFSEQKKTSTVLCSLNLVVLVHPQMGISKCTLVNVNVNVNSFVDDSRLTR